MPESVKQPVPGGISLDVVRMPLAPAWLACMSMALYLYLGIQGFRFAFLLEPNNVELKMELQRTLLLMCTGYLVEFMVAAFFNRTTMFGWSVSTFAMHHLPFALVTGGALLFDESYICLNTFRWTLTLDLMTGFNEATHAGKTLGLFSREVELPRGLLLLCLMIPLVFIESNEIWKALTGDLPTRIKVTACLVSLATAYHVFDVIPCCVVGIRKTWKKLYGKTEQSKSK